MSTHINTINALKGLTCVADNLVPVLDLRPKSTASYVNAHIRKHLTDAGIEIKRLNDEAKVLLHENAKLKEQLSNKTTDFEELLGKLANSHEYPWGELLYAVRITEAGRGIYSPTIALTAANAVDAIKKTEADRKEALRTVEAFQKTRLKVEPTSDLFDVYSYAYFTHYASAPSIYGLTSRRSGKVTYAQYMTISSEIIDEAIRASKIHPKWPTDVVHAVSILTEESGELMKAAIEYHYNNGDIEAVREEAIQTGAMALRVLMNIDKYNRPSDEK